MSSAPADAPAAGSHDPANPEKPDKLANPGDLTSPLRQRNVGLIEAYLRVLEVERKLSLHTVLSYRRDLLELVERVHATGSGRDLAQLDDQQIRRHAAHLHARGLSGRSIARALSAWRTFYDWLGLQNLSSANPVIDVRAPKTGKRLPKALPVEQAVALAASRGGDEPADLRDAAIRELLYSSGLRLAELVGLDVTYVNTPAYRSAGWLDPGSAEVMVTGKGGKQRAVPVGQPALEALRVWLAVRDDWVRPAREDGRHALFLSPRGARITPRSVQLRLKAHAQQIGIPSNVHPHMLRHSFASHVLQSSGDLRAVQDLLGHSSIASTQVYTSLDFQRLAAVYDVSHPRAKKRTP